MVSVTHALLRQPFFWVIAANLMALVALAASPHAADFPVAILGIQAFIVVQVLLPSSRPVWQTPLCPANLAQIFFWVQLVLVPLLIGFFGVSQGTLPWLPSSEAINWACGLRALAYVSFCVAYELFSKRHPGGATAFGHLQTGAAPREPSGLVLPFLVVGVVGFFLSYGSIGGFLEYVSSPIQQKERDQEAATLATAASTFLRPFLGFGLVLAWSAWLAQTQRTAAPAAVTLLLVAALAVVNFSYNRGALLAPIIGVAAAYSFHVRRISFAAVSACAAAALFVALAFGWYRSSDSRLGELSTAALEEAWSGKELVDFAQVYASGPQMTAFLMEDLATDNRLYWGKTLLPSLLYPVPVLGKPFRADSGVILFNDMIYHDPEIVDQNIAYDAELFMNFHVPGVVLGYALLGCIAAFFQGCFLRAASAAESYAWFLMGLWAVFPGSLSVLSQIYVYFFWPLYIYLFVKALRPRPALVKELVMP
jgi:hypothetical protein